MFARTERLHRRLTDSFRQQRVRIVETIALRERFRFADPALRKVEAELWGGGEETQNAKHKTRNDKSEMESANDIPQSTDHGPRTTDHDLSGGVELWECSDPETEVRVVAQAIRDWVIGPAAENAAGQHRAPRYRQIGIIVPDMQGYGDALRRVLGEHGIPHFIDERRGLGHHPLVELLRSAVAIAESGWDREDLLLYMKTRLAGISEEEAAWVENYIIEHGITHVTWSEPWTWIAPNVPQEDAEANLPASARERLRQVNVVRHKVWGDLKGWCNLGKPKSENRNPKPEPERDGQGAGGGEREKKKSGVRPVARNAGSSCANREMGRPRAGRGPAGVWR